jgi:hypothetical protein
MGTLANLNGLIDQYGISMKLKKVEINPVLGREAATDEIDHYKCKLLKSGSEIEVYLSVDPEEHLTLEDVLLMLAMDASGCKLLEGYVEYKDQWTSSFKGSDGSWQELEEFWHEYGSRCRQTQKLRQFLGDTAYNDLVQTFGPTDFPGIL